MSSRERILAQIRTNKPGALPLPETFAVIREDEDLVQKFTAVLQGIGGKVNRENNLLPVQAYLQQQIACGAEVVNTLVQLLPFNAGEYAGKEALEVEAVHTVVVKAELAVAENGSVWLSEKSMGNRLLPFICQELVVVIEEGTIVADMHQAYQKIKVDEEGYGAFIAGPSKTADIEQSLVIGAHGPLALQVYLVPGPSPVQL